MRDFLSLQRNAALDLLETKRIDTHAFRKARYKLFSGDIDDISVVTRWLESQPDWTDDEFHNPDFVLEDMRDQELLAREARTYERELREIL